MKNNPPAVNKPKNAKKQEINITKKAMKITPEEMQALIARSIVLSNKENELKFLRNENRQYWKTLTKKYNLNPSRFYSIDQVNNLLVWEEK